MKRQNDMRSSENNTSKNKLFMNFFLLELLQNLKYELYKLIIKVRNRFVKITKFS